MDIEAEMQKLEHSKTAAWQRFFASSPLVKRLESGRFDERLYALYLIETFHSTSHDARNQALVAVCLPTQDATYMRYCFRHALEETGLEQMALHDLSTLSVVARGMPMTHRVLDRVDEEYVALLEGRSVRAGLFARIA